MAKEMRLRAVRRKHIDDEKLALAFLLLAKALGEQSEAVNTDTPETTTDGDQEAA